MRYVMLLVFILVPQIVFATGNAVHWLPSNIRLCTNTPDASSADNHEIAADNDFVAVVWDDDRNNPSYEDIYVNFSTDGGVTWQGSDRRINTNSAGTYRSIYPDIAVCGSRVYVVWLDTRFGQADVFFNYSSDYGQTWLPSDVRLNLGSGQGEKTAADPLVYASGNNVYVTWREYRYWTGSYHRSGIYTNYSLNGGATWQPTDVQIDDDNSSVETYQIRVDGDKVYAVWWRLGTAEDIYFNRSLNNGASWMTPLKISMSGTANREPVFDVEGSTIYAFWNNADSSSRRIRFNFSEDGGVSWHETDIDPFSGSNPNIVLTGGMIHLLYFSPFYTYGMYYVQYLPQSGWKDPVEIAGGDIDRPYGKGLTVKGSFVFSSWGDVNALADQNVRCNYSLNGGTGFVSNTTPIYLNDNAGFETARAVDTVFTVSGKKVHVAWIDYRNGKPDIYYTMGSIPARALPFLNLLLD
ncbi:MAG TPA: sialidase family protein [Syntrophales bacterium]|nr:sialidase family protein [Syntrophales bacterium]